MTRVWKNQSLLLIVIFALLLAACGNNNGNNSSTDTPKANEEPMANTPAKDTEDILEPVKLRVNWWGADERHQATQKAMELYRELNPHVSFDVDFSDHAGHWQKLATMSAAGNAPDIFQMDSHIGEYAARGQLADLSSVNTADIDEALLNTGKVDGVQMGIPLGSNATGLVYNKAALEKLGVALPENGWTWDEYVAYGKEVKSKIGKDKYVLFDAANDMNTYDAYQLSKGKGRKVTDDGKFNIDRDTFLEWLAMHDELRAEGIVPPASVTFTDKAPDATLDLMVNGTTLFRKLAFAAQFSSWESLMPNSIGSITLPTAAESGGHLQYSMFWSVSEKSPNIDEAKKFIDWFVNDFKAAEILMTSRGIPVSSKVLEHLTPSLTPIDQMAINHIAAVAKDAQPFTIVAGWANWEYDFKAIVEKQMFGQQSAEDTYEEIVKLGKEYEENI